MQIGGTRPGGENESGHDQVIATGPVNLLSADLQLKLQGTPIFSKGQTLFLLVNHSGAALEGSFTTLNGAPFDPNRIALGDHLFRLTHEANFTGGGSDGIANDVALITIPEPNSAGLLMAGAGPLLIWRKRRHDSPAH